MYARLIENADEEGRDSIDTALNADVSGLPQEESAEEFEARRAQEMALFNRLSAGG